MKKVLAGRGAVDYYLAQTRHGLADYYLPEPDERAGDGAVRALSAPGSSWWGGGVEALGLDGEVDRDAFVAMYATGRRPDGEAFLGSRFRLPEDADAAKAAALRAAADIEDPYERWMAKHDIRRSGKGASVAAWDCTFSPVKSVSLLWAAGDEHVQREVWAAHEAAVDAGLRYLQEHAAYVRAGRNGVRVLDTSGLVVARMNEWTSRSGDMQLHTHCLVLNRAQTLDDSKWRALDGRALLAARHGAGAIYNRTVEAELTRRLGVGWRDRPDGLRELEGVDDELIELFSTRRRAITARLEEMAEAYRDRHGIDPPPAVLSSMAQHATLTTRPGKRSIDASHALEAWEAAACEQGRALADVPRRVLAQGAARRGVDDAVPEAEQVAAMLARLSSSGRSTFTRHDLLRAALDVVPTAGRSADELRAAAEHLLRSVVASTDLLAVTAPDPIVAPDAMRRADGTSVYEQPDRQRWALRATLDQERWLLDIADEPITRVVAEDVIAAAVADHGLGSDQAAAARELLAADRRVGLLVGPAGAGKTRTLRAVVDAWRRTHGAVLGLSVSQAAAQVLGAEADVPAENTAKWLYETGRGRWQLPHGVLMVIDEATMVSTADLVDLVAQARAAEGKVLLVGDPAQLGAIGAGGAFGLLTDRYGAAQLTEIRRFTEGWEAAASLKLRARDPSALADYAMRVRIHGGTRADVETELFNVWCADALGDGSSERRSVLMIVTTNEQAAVLAERARHARLDSGAVLDGPTAQLRDNVASVGDHLVTRRNDRRLRTSRTGWVANGDVWTVLEVHPDGAIDARRHGDGATLTLPADYLAQHAHLAYATTAHRAQGMTVDVCHAAITADATHEQLYVAATRGRDANHLWVVTGLDPDLVGDRDMPEPEEVLSRVLARRDPDRRSVHEAIEDALNEMGGLARLGAIFEDASRTATSQWLAQTLRRRGLAAAIDDPEWPTLVARARAVAVDGHDIEQLVGEAVTARPLDDAHSIAAVLHWRLGALADPLPARRNRPPLGPVPNVQTPEAQVAQHAAELMWQRMMDIRAAVVSSTQPVRGAEALGPRPVSPEDIGAWISASVAVTTYRERYEVADHVPMLGPRPAVSRPDARAAWDDAQLWVDRYQSKRLRDLEEAELTALDARLRATVADCPRFDPAELERARGDLDEASGAWRAATGGTRRDAARRRDRARCRVDRLERHAAAYDDWLHAAEQAATTRRQIAIEQRRRRRDRTRAHPARAIRR